MESLVVLPRRPEEAAKQIIEEAERRGATVRLLGGVAFKLQCRSTHDPRFYRENKDIDLAGRKDQIRRITETLEYLGYRPREVFNKLNMGERLIYYDTVNRRRVDVFLDRFTMCHSFDLRESLRPGTYTLPITDLVMTKLQVIQMTEKEYMDLIAAFTDFEVGSTEDTINASRIAGICARDWGVYTTFRKSLASVREKAIEIGGGFSSVVAERIDRLLARMEEEPKSLSWKLRARIGERARWYELPEQDSDAPFF
jgi:hypothetical protein